NKKKSKRARGAGARQRKMLIARTQSMPAAFVPPVVLPSRGNTSNVNVKEVDVGVLTS
ncbi:unnamed protein product, partial [Amoebophrya sp. A25]